MPSHGTKQSVKASKKTNGHGLVRGSRHVNGSANGSVSSHDEQSLEQRVRRLAKEKYGFDDAGANLWARTSVGKL